MKKGLKILFFIFLFFINLSIVENVFANRCEEDVECPSGTYCLLSGVCQPKHIDGWGPCARNEMCVNGNCLNSYCQEAGARAVGNLIEGVNVDAVYSDSTCNNKCPIKSGYNCRFFNRIYEGSALKDQYKCIKNDSGYVRTTCLKMYFGLPFDGMRVGDCVDYDQGIPTILKAMLQFLLSSIGVLAVILIIIAGFMWSFSAGNKKNVEKAISMIKNALIGLILVIFSGSMLALVNPALIDTSVFKAIKINKINLVNGEVEFEGVLKESCTIKTVAEKYRDRLKDSYLPNDCTAASNEAGNRSYLNSPYGRGVTYSKTTEYGVDYLKAFKNNGKEYNAVCRYHFGNDLVGNGRTGNSSLYSVFPSDAVVLENSTKSDYGNYIVLQSKDKKITALYAHMVSKSLFKVGDTVKANSFIGTQGNTGMSTGYHLHLEIKVNGKYVNPNCLGI